MKIKKLQIVCMTVIWAVILIPAYANDCGAGEQCSFPGWFEVVCNRISEWRVCQTNGMIQGFKADSKGNSSEGSSETCGWYYDCDMTTKLYQCGQYPPSGSCSE